MKIRLGVACLVGLGLIATAVQAADESQVLRQQAERFASEDRCPEAIERARGARALDAGDARAALVEGRCLLREGDYTAAIEPLETARGLAPSVPGVTTDLVQCHYHRGDLDAARREIERAEIEQPGDARLALYKGLVLARSAQNEEAAASFDRAASLDPSLADAASLYAARTWATARDRERAEQALERASQADPDSEWGREASRELAQLRELTRRRAWARLEGGLEWTDNVNFSGDVSPNAQSQLVLGPFRKPRDDLRGIWEADAGVEIAGTHEWSTGVGVAYQANAHAEIHEKPTGRFDWQAPSGWLWFDRRLGEKTWLRLQPFGGYSWLGYDPFVLYGGGGGEISTRFDEAWGGRVFVQATVNDYQFRPKAAGLNAAQTRFARRARDRDGVQVWTGLEGNHTLGLTDGRLRAGSAYERYEAEGRDWSHHGWRSWVGLNQPLPADFRFEVEGSYTWRPYDHRSSYQRGYFTGVGLSGTGRTRRDQLWRVETELAHRVNEWLELAVHWRYRNQESNVRVFDHEQHVVGGTFTVFVGNY